MKLFSKITLAVFIITIVFTAIQFPNLPSEVPSHYNIMGEADAWANKWFIFFIPLLGFGLWLLLGQVEKFPEFINMPNDGRPLNAAQQQNSIFMLHTLRNEVLLFMSLLTLKEVLTSIGYPIRLGIWEFVIFIGVLTVTLIWFIVKNQKLKTA
ncbi:DUF1648 domain-containing protein [Solibacillus sp. MA9]|uniref:DUF1648 domain-containing protein n=1 Tax=Solibacillus palustris TaxID=2908203 RepID=A0ABS9UH96_9BACL|nr:DUF1648 domain-containing protein [Solibacillus sp. MA9]MCH7323736.1 DUF1648 domain-containing protein [Solibacillus sp. MA9]